MIRTTVRSFISYILLGIFVPALAVAEGTHDGFPPAMETICDKESGAAYGLCNAYCEAMDCDSSLPSATSTACQKVFATFDKITGRPFPCELDCPPLYMDGFETFKLVISDPELFTSCETDFDTSAPGLGAPEIYLYINPTQGPNFQAASVFYSKGQDDITGFKAGDEGDVAKLSETQYEACFTVLENAANSAQIPCVPR